MGEPAQWRFRHREATLVSGRKVRYYVCNCIYIYITLHALHYVAIPSVTLRCIALHTYIYIYIHVYIYTCIYIYIDIYIYTHTYTYIYMIIYDYVCICYVDNLVPNLVPWDPSN